MPPAAVPRSPTPRLAPARCSVTEVHQGRGSGCGCMGREGLQARGACPRRPLARRWRSSPPAASPRPHSIPLLTEQKPTLRGVQSRPRPLTPGLGAEGAGPRLCRLPAHFPALRRARYITHAGGGASSVTGSGHGAAVGIKGAVAALSTRRKPRRTHAPTAG